MSSPRLEVDLHKIRRNTHMIAEELKRRGIHVTAVTKAVCGHPAVARAMLDGGAVGLAEARLSNVKRLRAAGTTCPITLIRTPMLSQVNEVVQACEASYNTELPVIAALAGAALRQNTVHGIILMVEMGDLREGIMQHNLGDVALRVVQMPGVTLEGIGANFACLNGIAPTAAKMRTLSALAYDAESRCGSHIKTVSGGNSANLPWALGGLATGRVNDLRLGEAILLGVDPITGGQIRGLHLDAIKLVVEVIETDAKPAYAPVSYADRPASDIRLARVTSETMRIILGVGQQDTDTVGLSMPAGITFIGATSDHLVVGTNDATRSLGSEIRFGMNYSALMRAMAAPDVNICLSDERPAQNGNDVQTPDVYVAVS